MKNYFKELHRIADTLESKSKEDAEILREASFKLLPPPKPKSETVTEVLGGYKIDRRFYI